MKPIKNSQFVFTDTDDGLRKVFLREKYFEFVCLLITDYYEKEIVENDFYKYFVDLLNNLEDDSGVFFIEHQMPPYFAQGIIQNSIPAPHSYYWDERMKEIIVKFDRKYNMKGFIIDYSIPS